MLRLRIRVTNWPRRALELTDTPRPKCRTCGGSGSFDYAGPDGEYGGSELCDCWDPSRAWLLLPLPRRRKKEMDPWAVDGPPF